MKSAKIKVRKEPIFIKSKLDDKNDSGYEKYIEDSYKDNDFVYDGEDFLEAKKVGKHLVCPHCGEKLIIDNIDIDNLSNTPFCFCENCYGLSSVDMEFLFDNDLL
ncbi:MAG TPA: hypothetical protein PKN54_00735 [Candidatus Cloacimonas acidaminovorans]|mgnify:CR=1 FL=1|nr:hypothetical protein [Candidatus Cloacimonas acidaminovorans]